MVETDLVTSIPDAEGLDYLKAQSLVISAALVMVTQDEILLARQSWRDVGEEVEEALIATKEEIAQVDNRGIFRHYLFPPIDHHDFVIVRTARVLHDVFVVEVCIGNDVER